MPPSVTTLGATSVALLILGWDLRVKTANKTFYNTFKVDPFATEGRLVYELSNGQWNIPGLRDLLENVRGFGTTLIERSVTYDLQGEAEIEFRPQGLHVKAWFTVPWG